MKKPTSIKTRITIWYTSLMLILIVVVLALVGTLSYQLSIVSIEKDVSLQVTQVLEKITSRRINVFEIIDNDEEFKNVSLYGTDGRHLAGQYIYDIDSIPFVEGTPRSETVDSKTYIVYDVFRPGPPGKHLGFWIRGAESVNSTMLLGRSTIFVILIIIPLIILMTAIGGYYITRRAFLPINSIIKTANEITSQNDVTRRIEIKSGATKDELHNLSITLNNMLDKIENLIKQEKQFTSDASHELRTPISVILAQGEYLLEVAKSPKERELAGTIVTKAKQISTLVSRLLLLARIDQNRQVLNKEKVDLGAIVDIAFENMSGLASQKNITLVSNIAENIIVDADEALLLSAITNLISNGIKYGKIGGSVRVSANKTGTATTITVADDGNGIAPENINEIWKRFYRVDDVRNDEYSSNGLGLSMVKSIVELHNGSISVKSELGKGSEFRIELS